MTRNGTSFTLDFPGFFLSIRAICSMERFLRTVIRGDRGAPPFTLSPETATVAETRTKNLGVTRSAERTEGVQVPLSHRLTGWEEENHPLFGVYFFWLGHGHKHGLVNRPPACPEWFGISSPWGISFINSTQVHRYYAVLQGVWFSSS